jgi:cytolysin-activating lysine-acyltransferase
MQNTQTSILKQLSKEQKFKLIGEIASLMISSDLHINYRLKDIRDIFMPAVDTNQFRIYHNKNGFPVGFICWAFLSEKIDKLYGEGKYKLKPTDWNSGKNFWIIELIAPFGHGKQIISELRYKIFPNQTGKALMFSKDKKELRVVKIRGFGSNSTNTIEEKF